MNLTQSNNPQLDLAITKSTTDAIQNIWDTFAKADLRASHAFHNQSNKAHQDLNILSTFNLGVVSVEEIKLMKSRIDEIMEGFSSALTPVPPSDSTPIDTTEQ
jgi:hypothetical protein